MLGRARIENRKDKQFTLLNNDVSVDLVFPTALAEFQWHSTLQKCIKKQFLYLDEGKNCRIFFRDLLRSQIEVLSEDGRTEVHGGRLGKTQDVRRFSQKFVRKTSINQNNTPPEVEKTGKAKGTVISRPYNVEHNTHLDLNFEWQGDDVENQFVLLDKLGEGSYGAVYKAVHKETGFHLAIKMLTPSPQSDPVKKAQELAIIQDEIQMLKKIRHSNITCYYGSWGPDSQGRLWIMMDVCQFGSVCDLLATNRVQMTEKQVAFVLAACLRALTYLHIKKIVHPSEVEIASSR